MLSLSQATLFTAALWVTFLVAQIIYRLFLHPLAKFPGSRLASCSYLYEFYYDVIKRGKYVHKIEEMHRRYGPIIRINPHELHIYDSDYFDSIYCVGKWNKPLYMVYSLDLGLSAFGTTDHKVHRLRRGAVNPFFSKRKVNELQHVIQQHIKKLCDKLEKYRNTGVPIDFESAFGDFTLDIISQYCMDECLGLLDREDFDSSFRRAFRGLGELGHMVKLSPWIMTIFSSLPKSLVLWLNPNIKLLLDWDDNCLRMAKDLLKPESQAAKGHPTVMREILTDPELSSSDKTAIRLKSEAKTILNAGTGTVSWALVTAVWYLTTMPDKMERLRAEIRTVMPDPLCPAELTKLEQLPYFTAVLQETLRLGFGAPMRSARAAPDRILTYIDQKSSKEWQIPQGTAVSMSIPHLHFDPNVFTNPHTFYPERWLVSTEERFKLEKYFAPFSRGSRNCLGISLAWAEMYISLAHFVMRIDLEPYETTHEHIEFVSDMFLAEPKNWKDGPRFLVK